MQQESGTTVHSTGAPPAVVTVPTLSAVAAPPGAHRETHRLLHVLNGDAAADRLRAAGIQGQITLSADLLYEGPVTPTSSPERRRRERARFLAESGYDDYDRCLATLAGWDHALEGFRAHDEVVLWFEHDLFDQLHLCRLLSWFGGRDSGLTGLSLVLASDYLGRMPPHRMTSLLDAREPATAAQKRLARTAWEAFCAPSPLALAALPHADTSALPHLAAALRRHLEEFPATGDGLARTERQALAAVAAGPLPFAALFGAVQAMEESIFMTDLSLLRRLRDLAAGPRPLLRSDAHPEGTPRLPGSGAIAITAAGRAVLAGRADWIEIRGGIDRWLGGVHLLGPDAAWRWDPEARRLVGTGGPR
jgi:hypothetical protein